MAKIVKKDIVDHVVLVSGMNRNDAQNFIDCYMSLIINNAINGVQIPVIGKFVYADRKERMARAVRTGEPAIVKARKKLVCRFGKKIKSGYYIEKNKQIGVC